MRFQVAAGAMLLVAASAHAQLARVSGRVIEEGRGTPVGGVTVRISGETAQVTDSLGRFQFLDVVPGRYIITAASIGFRFRTIELSVAGDTTLAIAMTRRIVSLDTMVVRPRYVRIKGTAVDSVSGDALLQAQATLYPGGQFVGARTGVFVFDSVPPGPVTIIVEGLEHMPTKVELDVQRDTSFRVKMGIDSVALRMIAMQVKRLDARAQVLAMPRTTLNRDLIGREPTTTIGDLILRKTYEDPAGVHLVPSKMPDESCFFLDDNKVAREVYETLAPELIERVEIYRSPGAIRGSRMIRVYTKRYVATLPRQQTLPRVLYMPGTRVACA